MRKETPHANNDQPTSTLSRSIRRRALRIINNNAIDPTTRGFIRYALGINDPWTPSLVRRAESGEIFGEDLVSGLEIKQSTSSRLNTTLMRGIQTLREFKWTSRSTKDLRP